MRLKKFPVVLFTSLLSLIPSAIAQKVVPTTAGTGTATRWTFTMGPMDFLAGAKHGGRIHALRFDDSDILHMDTGSATNYGSTFWPSPQAVWNWPPPANIDGSGAYTAELADTVLTLVGQVDNTTSLRFRKEYWADAGDSTFNMRFTMVNTGAARAWAPWQNSRLDTGGVYFFPAGEGPATGDLAQFVRDSIGMKWYQHGVNTTLNSGTTKFFADGMEGWFAHVTTDRILFLKKFADAPVSKKAPDPENEIQIYTTNKPLNNSDFVEMEVQGSYDSIASGDSSAWDMKWYVRKLPDSITVAIGNPDLVDFVNHVLDGSAVSVHRGERAARATASRLGLASGRVSFTLRAAAAVTLDVVDGRGRVAQRLHAGVLPEGTHAFRLAPVQGLYRVVLRDAQARVLDSRLIAPF